MLQLMSTTAGLKEFCKAFEVHYVTEFNKLSSRAAGAAVRLVEWTFRTSLVHSLIWSILYYDFLLFIEP